MTEDRERLVEAMTRAAHANWCRRLGSAFSLEDETPEFQERWLASQRAALDAIDASGTHKVIPVWLWDDMREAYLAETTPRSEDCDPDHRQNR